MPTLFGKASRNFFSPLGARKSHGTVKKFDIVGKNFPFSNPY
jgi:hypothetical protein